MTDNSRKYAATTSVPVEKSKADISKLLDRHGATDVMVGNMMGQAVIYFSMSDRHVRFMAKIPENAQAQRVLYRNLLICMKGRLEGINAGVESFEEAFLANIIIAPNYTVGDDVLPKIQSSYSGGNVKLLEGF